MKDLAAALPTIGFFILIGFIASKAGGPSADEVMAIEAAKAGCNVTPILVGGTIEKKIDCPCRGPKQ